MSTVAAPGYRDDHLHLLACAAARRSIDVRGAATVSELLETVQRGIRERDRAGDATSWLRVWGYDDALLAERRHPTVAELDAVTFGRPAVLHHLTGHVAVVNTAAGRALGLGAGEVLVERHDVLAAVPRPERAEIVAELAAVLADLAAHGIRACTDATHTNDLAALELLADAVAAAPAVSVTAMVGANRLESLGGLVFGARVYSSATAPSETGSTPTSGADGDTREAAGASGVRANVRIGHAKVMPPHDDDSAIDELVATARVHGFPVAIHAMDIDTMQAALDALEAHPPARHADTVDRIEHCALALPEQLDRIARLGVAVVTQPSFVTRRAPKYRDQLSAAEQQWLWPLASLLRRGIRVTLSSDAPTVPADPTEWMAAAIGRDLAPAERVDAATALRLCAAPQPGCEHS
ncbi:amidohydrolase family protein [Candidatus Poriferisodalis sp.]|uniref:amidohydrolase family protein n=1 Tax=Candidatus Poriferisodalis sp. TaxID=3101277 RepID=UPI003B01D646